MPLGAIGVYIFFTISGYLVSESWARDPHVGRFLIRRSLRIFPGLIVCTLLSVFLLGPLLTTFSLRDYFAHPHTWAYLKNVFLHISFHLPGMFENNRLHAVNGSLWSLPAEFFMYLVVVFLGLFARLRKEVVLSALALWLPLSFFWAMKPGTPPWIVYATDVRHVVMPGAYFLIGMAFYVYDLKRYFTVANMTLAFVLLFCMERWIPALPVVSWFVLPFVVLGFGFSYSEKLALFTRYGDFSYGVYIYAFPIEQALVSLYPKYGIATYMTAVTVLTLMFAAMSWHWVEKPAMKYKPRSPARMTEG